MKYRSPEAFKQAISERLKEMAQIRKVPLLRLQTRFLFERLLVRVQAAFPDVTVKGGAALEFRLAVARVTKDLDLGLQGVPSEMVLPRLQRAAQSDFGDWIRFLIEDHPDYPELQTDGLRYTGRRLRVPGPAGRPPALWGLRARRCRRRNFRCF